MTVLEIVLAVLAGALSVALTAVSVMLVKTRKQVGQLTERLERPRLVPRPSDAVRTVVGTAIKVRDRGIGGAIRSSIDDLALWADVERPDLARLGSDDGTVTILFSDIEDSTSRNHDLGDRRWVRLLAKHDRVLRKAIDAHAGHVIKTQGDGFMVAFAEPTEALGAACDIQRQLAKVRPGSSLSGVSVRIGVHKGSAIQRDGDLFGRNVAYAARVAAQAAGGEIMISSALRESLPYDAGLLEMREAELKGVPGIQQLYVVDWPHT